MKILDGNDIAKLHGLEDYEDWMKNAHKLDKSGNAFRWNGKIARGPSYKAFIERGRWIAKCDCGAALWVCPDYKIGYCHECGCDSSNGAARPVLFPNNIDEIAKALEERPMKEIKGGGAVSRRLNARPVIKGVGLNWHPGESPNKLRKQHKNGLENETIDKIANNNRSNSNGIH